MSEKKPSRNRRATLRRTPRGKVKIVCYKGSLDLGQNLAVTLHDISEAGARLLLKSALAPGQDVLLLLESMGHSRPVKISGTVAWAIPSNDAFLTGIRFQKYLPYEDIARMC